MINQCSRPWPNGLAAAIAGCLLFFSLGSSVVAADGQEAIDRKRAQQLFKRSQKGEQLSSEDQAYLERAQAARRHGQGSEAQKSSEKNASGVGSVEPKPSSQKAAPENPTAEAGTIAKATPTGIWLLLNSYGFKHPDQLAKLQATPGWTNANVDGVVLRADWDKIEGTEGQVDWSYFDRGLELAKRHGKRIEILVPAGKHSPAWVYAAGAKKFVFSHHNGKPEDYMPIPWDPVLREKFAALMHKIGQRYDASPYLSLVTMTGFGHSTESWFAGPDDMAQYNAIGGNAKWLEGAKWFSALYSQAFPKTPFLIAMCPPSRDDEGKTTLEKLVDDGVKDYPGRFGLMACSLAPNDKPTSPKLSYQSVQKFSGQTVTGLEMLRATRTMKGTLKAALDTAVALKAQFVHIYESDAVDPKQQPVLAEARAQLKRYQFKERIE